MILKEQNFGYKGKMSMSNAPLEELSLEIKLSWLIKLMKSLEYIQ